MSGTFISRVACCALLALGLALAAQSLGWLRALEDLSWDARVRLLARPGAATDSIRMIELDQNSLDWGERENALPWPWPREMYGLILDFCRRAPAQVIVFDVLFSEPSLYGVADDQALAQAGQESGRLLLSLVLAGQSGDRTSWPESWESFSPLTAIQWQIKPADFPALPRANFPVWPIIDGAAALGVVNQPAETDGVFRAWQPLAFFADRPLPALALAAFLLQHPATQIGGDVQGLSLSLPQGEVCHIPLNQQGRAILNFRGPGGSYVSYSAAAIIQSELRLREGQEPIIDPAALAGKQVLFGFSAPALLDLRSAPPGGVFTGLELHATALDNLISNDFIRPLPNWVGWLLMLLLSFSAAVWVLKARSAGQLGLASAVCLALPPLLAGATYRALYWLPLAPLFTATLLTLAAAIMLAYATEGRQRRFLKNAFSQYLSPKVISQIIKEPERLNLGGEKRVLSMFFSDLAGFSTLSETLEPEDLTRLLNQYLSAMSDIILHEEGTIDKYEGDAIIAFWNAPQAQDDHAARALRTALSCQEALARLNPQLACLAGRELTMRIGLNTGPAIVGNMGSHHRFDYTMLGDAVNLAARLEGANKEFGTSIMASQALMEAAGPGFASRELGRIVVVGRQEATLVLEPMYSAQAMAKQQVLQTFATGLIAYQGGRLTEAAGFFATIASIDPPAAAYLKRCQETPEPLPTDWDGLWRLSGK